MTASSPMATLPAAKLHRVSHALGQPAFHPATDSVENLVRQGSSDVRPSVARQVKQRSQEIVEQLGGLVRALRWRCEGFLRLGTGAGETASGSNARVVTAPFRSASRVNVPAAIASATQRRPAASKARRHTSWQNICGLPPLTRGANPFPHHMHARSGGSGPVIASLIFPAYAASARLRRLRAGAPPAGPPGRPASAVRDDRRTSRRRLHRRLPACGAVLEATPRCTPAT